jgi:hypothetical protein
MCAQSGDIVDVGRLKRISVMFGMLDEARKSVGWYQFVSNGKPKSKQELAKPAPKLPGVTAERFGYQIAGGVDFTLRVRKHVQLDGLAIHPKGTPATLTLEVGHERFRKIACRISHLKTKGKEVVTFPIYLQYDSDPSWPGPIHGTVKFLEISRYDRNLFPYGPPAQLDGCIP